MNRKVYDEVVKTLMANDCNGSWDEIINEVDGHLNHAVTILIDSLSRIIMEDGLQGEELKFFADQLAKVRLYRQNQIENLGFKDDYQGKGIEVEKVYNGRCSECGEPGMLTFDKHDNEPIHSMEEDGSTDLLATSRCKNGHMERVIIYGKARLV